MEKVRVGVIGLGFGKEFVPIYQEYPRSEVIAVSRRNGKELNEAADQFNVKYRYTDWRDMLKNPEIDAIHIVSPILDHYEMAVETLKAGKHCACTVPMGVTIDQLKEIVKLSKETGKYYMMMETSVYTREFLYVKELVESGKLGRIQFVRGSHMQDMGLEGWPEYWLGFPPFWYGTHAVSPLFCITGKRPESVICHGSGSISEEMAKKYGSPFAVETATFTMKDSNVVAEATRSLYETVRQYRESFDIYGDKMAFEWDQIEDEGEVLFPGGEAAERFKVPDTDALLPQELKKFTLRESIQDANHVSFIQGAGHGGSHPHLVKEFVDAIYEGRQPKIDAATSAYWTAAGICAHESAVNGAAKVMIPDFDNL